MRFPKLTNTICRSLLADEFRYLLVTIEYEPFAHLGRPHSISYNAVKELFGSFSNVKFAAQLPASSPWKPEWKENIFAMYNGSEDRVQYWQARWATGQSQWHSDQPHKYLVKYLDTLTQVALSLQGTAALHTSTPG
jgi:hypothetical protein